MKTSGKCRVILTMLIMFFLLTAAHAGVNPEIKFQHLSLEKGISHNLTYCILQDRAGFMWFGTLFGLIRYDGQRFDVFRNDPFDSTSISRDDILSLYEDRNGILWIGTYEGGLNRYDPDTGTFLRYQHDPDDSLSLSDNIVWAICEDRQGNLWIGTEIGLNRLEPDAGQPGRFERYFYDETDPKSLRDNHIRALHLDRRGRLWVGSNGGGLHLYYEEEDAFIRLNEKHSVGSNNVISIFEDRQSVLWLATWGGGLKQVLFRDPDHINRNTVEYITYVSNVETNSISSNNIWSIEEDEKGNFWIGTYNGLNYWNRRNGLFRCYTHEYGNPHSISSDYVSAVYRDRSNVFWIGTFRGNIDKFVPNLQHFEHFSHNPDVENTLNHNEVSALYEDSEGIIWVGTLGGGLNRYNPQDNSIAHYTHDPHDGNSISSNSVLSIIGDHDGHLWIGTANGLNRFDGRNRFTKYNHSVKNEKGMSRRMITALLEDEPGKLWVGTASQGLQLLNTETRASQYFEHSDRYAESLINNYITCLYKDSRNRVWVGTFDGLERMNRTDSVVVFKHFLHDPADSSTISNNNIYCFLEDSEGRFWIGTSNGLNRYNPVDESFRRYHIEDGMPNDVVCSILEDNDGTLWLSTQKGLSKFDPSDDSFKNFDLTHGLQSNMFNVGAAIKTRCNLMLFGGINGFNRFDPSKIRLNDYIPPVYITRFKVFDVPMKFPGAIQSTKEITLSYKQNFFTIAFAALDFHVPEKNKYAYKLEGVDPAWVECGTKTYASYTNLDPGAYTFRVRGSNNDGVWNRQGRSMRIRILPPFWATWWFRSMGLALFLFLVSAIIYYIRMRAERKTELNKRIAELKLQALRAQMNPHFIFNTINAIQYFINFNDQKSAYTYLSLFSKLLRMTLDNSEKATIPVSEEILRLKLYLELQLLRFDNKFSYRIQVDQQIDQHNIEIPTMIIQPYVENAVQHGIGVLEGKGHIDIHLHKKNGSLECMIQDDGIGIRESKRLNMRNRPEHKSTAMRVTEERLDILNVAHKDHLNIKILDRADEEPGKSGTKVTIHIPL